MPITEIRSNLYHLTVGAFQAYLWRDQDGVTLIDTAGVGAGPELAGLLGEVGIATTDVDRLVLTHFHGDHAGAAADVAAWGDVEVLAGEGDAPIIRGEVAPPAPNLRSDAERQMAARMLADLPQAPPSRVDRELTDGVVLDIAGGAQVIAGPGHTEGSIGLFLTVPRVLFTGDTVAHFQDQVLVGPFNLDTDRAVESFRLLAGFDADVACFGHGDPIVGNAHETLAAAAKNPITM
ncbi:MAG TPA: MBL fold metallo-hydrolase [Pseudonocardiaceae bacterium]|nr:MBL fold metallo-hydrolase [Pseudonocardiaceae bacterium]